MENKELVTSLVEYIKTEMPNVDYDDSGIADPESFPICVLSNFSVNSGENGDKVSFTIDHWSLAENHSADELQEKCDIIVSALDKKAISFGSSNYAIIWFDNEQSVPEEPDYVHRVQSFSGNIYYGG